MVEIRREFYGAGRRAELINGGSDGEEKVGWSYKSWLLHNYNKFNPYTFAIVS
jgi:hypothetical protein